MSSSFSDLRYNRNRHLSVGNLKCDDQPTIEANSVTGEVIFSLHEDALSSDGNGFLPLLQHDDVVLLRKSRGSPFVDLQLCHH